ncbi:MAG: CpaF family protein, partial [Selenomonas sp.]|nr:CpaF family protein [Selenomonas sp.]
MSLLTSLGRIDGINKQVMIFSSHDEGQENIEDRSYQAAKHRIHQLIVDGMTPDEQKVLSAANNDSHQIDEVIHKYCQQVI